MLGVLIIKELRAVVLSPKFPATFAVCAIMIILSVVVGIQEFRATERQNEAAQLLADQSMREETDWKSISNSIYRRPDPMQIFVSGVAYDLGRTAEVGRYSVPLLASSMYAGDPIFAVFRFLDVSFIVLVVLSLLAIVFTFDAICGEREAGTLRLVFSHQVTRAQYLIAKCVGAWVGLVVPLGIPILIGVLFVQLSGIPMTAEDWLRLMLLLGVALLVVSFFIVFGVLISTLTRRPSVSFLLCLTSWVVLVFVIPRAGILVGNQTIHVPTIGSVSGQLTAYWSEQWEELNAGFNSRLTEYEHRWGYEDPAFQQKFKAAEDTLQVALFDRVWDFENRLLQEKRHAQVNQQHLAFALSRISPACIFQLAEMSLANTDVDLKTRYEESLSRYSATFRSYATHKEATSAPKKPAGTGIQLGGGKMIWINSVSKDALDISDLPAFAHPSWPADEALSQVAIDAGLLLCFIFAAFAGAWVAFMRYDLR